MQQFAAIDDDLESFFDKPKKYNVFCYKLTTYTNSKNRRNYTIQQ